MRLLEKIAIVILLYYSLSVPVWLASMLSEGYSLQQAEIYYRNHTKSQGYWADAMMQRYCRGFIFDPPYGPLGYAYCMLINLPTWRVYGFSLIPSFVASEGRGEYLILGQGPSVQLWKVSAE